MLQFWWKWNKKIKSNPQGLDEQNPSQSNGRKFFDRIAFLRMRDDDKSRIANEVISESFGWQLYRVQFILSSIIASLWLLTNSIPVIIGGMLIAPILQPIKTFAFAVTTWSKHSYIKALKMMVISIFVAVFVAFIIAWIVPFAGINNEILSRTSPTIVDLFIALASGVIAVLSIAYKRLSESIAGVAIAVALMPPLCVVGIGLQFLNWDITIGSWLLFLTNLVAIIIVWIVLFYAFWFFPTNKSGQKRSFTMIVLITLTVWILTVPLWKGMQTISFNYKTNIIINETFENYFSNFDKSIEVKNTNHQNLDDETLRIEAILNIPDSLKITDQDKQELTQRLALSTQKSIELELSLIGISSVYIDIPKEDNQETILNLRLKKELLPYNWSMLVDLKIAEHNKFVVLATIFLDNKYSKSEIMKVLQLAIDEVLWSENTFFITWKESNKSELNMDEELLKYQQDLYYQIQILFPNAEIHQAQIKKINDLDDSNIYYQIFVDFTTSQNKNTVKDLLERWKPFLEKYLNSQVELNTKVHYISEWNL